VLAERYHVHMLATPREVHRALRYVLLNARRHMVAADSGDRDRRDRSIVISQIGDHDHGAERRGELD
jgi:hypothetical protein